MKKKLSDGEVADSGKVRFEQHDLVSVLVRLYGTQEAFVTEY